MVISPDGKLVSLHHAKTASNSVAQMLIGRGWLSCAYHHDSVDHLPVSPKLTSCDAGWAVYQRAKIEHYFCTVRNPFDSLVSHHAEHGTAQRVTVEWLEWWTEASTDLTDPRHLFKHCWSVPAADLTVIRFENLIPDLTALFVRFGLSPDLSDLERLGRTKERTEKDRRAVSPKEYWEADAVAWVESRWGEDLARFGYSFGAS